MTNDLTYFSEEKRLHPLTLLYRSILGAPTILIVIYFTSLQGGVENWLELLLMIFVLMLTIPQIFLNYYYFTFYITPRELVIRSGILSRRQRNIPIERIQNVQIYRNFLHKSLGLAKIQVETAGDTETEGVLDSVSLEDAEAINDVIKKYKKKHKEGSATDDYQEEESENIDKDKSNTIFEMPANEVIKFGMMRFRPILLVITIWILGFGQQFINFDDFAPDLVNIFERNFNQVSNTELALYVSFGILLVFAVSWLLDIILTFNQFYNFNLTKEDEKLYYKHGLLVNRSGAIPLEKLQAIVIKTNPIKKLFGYFAMELKTAGVNIREKNHETAIPFASYERITSIAKDIRNFEIPDEFHNVSKVTIRRGVIRYSLAYWLLLAPLVYFYPSLWYLYLFFPVFLLPAYLSYKFRGYYLSDNYAIIRCGVILQKMSIIPIEKIQTLHNSATFFQRRLGLSSVDIDTAAQTMGAESEIIDLEVDTGDALIDDLAKRFFINRL